jgi:3-hydroxybutyryl-CoA dehydrogenase
VKSNAPGLVGVMGAGTMGIGVAHCLAAAKVPVALVDISAGALDRAREQIGRNVLLYRLVADGLPDLSPEDVLANIQFTLDAGVMREADYVVENVTEKREVKAAVYENLDAICPPHCVFGVNTSAIPITSVAALTSRPARVVGTHFMNPAPLKQTVEVIRGYHTSDETIDVTRDLLGMLGKDCVVVNDSPGFVTNRVMMLTVNEAVFLLQEGVASAQDIDRLFRECFGHKMGPLETADLIGLDTVLLSLEVLYQSYADSKYRPSPLLRTMVDAGRCGRKSGAGFHSYE